MVCANYKQGPFSKVCKDGKLKEQSSGFDSRVDFTKSSFMSFIDILSDKLLYFEPQGVLRNQIDSADDLLMFDFGVTKVVAIVAKACLVSEKYTIFSYLILRIVLLNIPCPKRNANAPQES